MRKRDNHNVETSYKDVMSLSLLLAVSTMFIMYVYHCIVAVRYHRQGKEKKRRELGTPATVASGASSTGVTPVSWWNCFRPRTDPILRNVPQLVRQPSSFQMVHSGAAVHATNTGIEMTQLPTAISRPGSLRQRQHARVAGLSDASLRSASRPGTPDANRPQSLRLINLDMSGDGPARLVCCGFRSNLRAMDVFVTSLVLGIYVTAVASLMTADAPQAPPPRPQ